MKYFDTFVPDLAAQKMGLELFYEVKSNLRKEQVRLLSQAGITLIQPGIESLSNQVLKLMRKGVSALQNIQLLKWCKELGVQPIWNLLWGFPGESPQDYLAMAKLIALIPHLPPPGAMGAIRLDRFSPNFDQAAELGFAEVEPYLAYRYIYQPLPAPAVANMAYYFGYSYQQPQEVASYTRPVVDEVTRWRAVYEQCDLFYVDRGPYMLIWDLRPGASQTLTTLTGAQKLFYLKADAITSSAALAKALYDETGEVMSEAEVTGAMQPLVNAGLALQDGKSYLSLAIRLGDYSPKAAVLQRFQEALQSLGHSSNGRLVIPLQPSSLPY